MPSAINCQAQRGPFDIIGDVHGCFAELELLLKELGYRKSAEAAEGGSAGIVHPQGRSLVFVGDLIDRGPDPVGVLRLVMALSKAGTARCVIGNHDDKLRRKLIGRNVQMLHGLAETYAQLQKQPAAFREEVKQFLAGLPSHVLLDSGNLVVAHAGLRHDWHGQDFSAVRAYCLFGPTTGKLDQHGLPERLDWAATHNGEALVVYGHTPVATPRWQNNTVNIDTGCVFGGALTALRYPELETVSVPAQKEYAHPARPFLPSHSSKFS